MSEQERPYVGTGVWIRKEGTILMGKRLSKAGYGTWCPPGGKLEMNEDPIDCVYREVEEEVGVEIANVRFFKYTNDINPDLETHYITLHFVADWKSGEPEILEPQKCSQWGWYTLDTMPEPLFLATRNLLNTGYNPFNL